MTFEKGLEIFNAYLVEDTNCEGVLTKHGYTVMQWNENSKSWYGVEHCETPEDLRDELLNFYCMSEAQKITKTKRKLTDEETEKIQGLCKKLANKFK